MRGRRRYEMGEAFEGGAVAVMQVFRHGLGEGEEFGHRRTSSIEMHATLMNYHFRRQLMSGFCVRTQIVCDATAGASWREGSTLC